MPYAFFLSLSLSRLFTVCLCVCIGQVNESFTHGRTNDGLPDVGVFLKNLKCPNLRELVVHNGSLKDGTILHKFLRESGQFLMKFAWRTLKKLAHERGRNERRQWRSSPASFQASELISSMSGKPLLLFCFSVGDLDSRCLLTNHP